MSNIYNSVIKPQLPLFKASDFTLNPPGPWQQESDPQHTQHTLYVPGFGQVSVVNRRTGFGYGTRDTETGYIPWKRFPRWSFDKLRVIWDTDFWLACGMYDVRDDIPEEGLTFLEIVALVKRNANTCVGKEENDYSLPLPPMEQSSDLRD